MAVDHEKPITHFHEHLLEVLGSGRALTAAPAGDGRHGRWPA